MNVIPPSFQTARALEIINIGAVGLALSSIVSAVIVGVFGQNELGGAVSGLPTLLIGLAWAWLLRKPKTLAWSPIRVGWIASIPLALLNAALSAALLFSVKGSSNFDVIGFFAIALYGATLGAIVWIPALIATLVCFGVPIAWAQRLAKKGLAGEERGEWIVGLACLVMSLVGLFIAFESVPFTGSSLDYAIQVPRVLGILGALAGATTTGLAWARESRRRAFVAGAEAGKIPGYRIESSDEGKVLIRVVSQGKGYRVADFEQELFELDAEGEARRPKHLDDVGGA